jgi:hypothetical protein
MEIDFLLLRIGTGAADGCSNGPSRCASRNSVEVRPSPAHFIVVSEAGESYSSTWSSASFGRSSSRTGPKISFVPLTDGAHL